MDENKAQPPQDIPGPAEVREPEEDFSIEQEARGLIGIIKADAWRVIPMVIIGVAFIVLGPHFALWFNEPAYSAWGLFGGAAWITGAMTHGLRRALFPRLDLQALMLESSKEPVGSGLVVLGVCVVIAAIFGMVGSFLRT